MKRLLVVVLLLGMSTHARADSRDTWKVVFGGSLTLTLGGVATWFYGNHELNEVKDEQCAHGIVRPECPNPTGMLAPPGFMEESNRRGERAELLTYVGGGMTVVGLAVSGVAFYKGFIAKPKREPTLVLTPTASKHTAGASLTLRW